jgi:DNA-binding SARP family transcriptional activator
MRSLPAKQSRIGAAVLAVLAVAAIVGLGLNRPAWPHLSGSITSALTIAEVERFVLCGAWALSILLVLLILRSAAHKFIEAAATRAPVKLTGSVLPMARPRTPRHGGPSRSRSAYVLTIPPRPTAELTTDSTPTPSITSPIESPQSAEVDPPADSRQISIAVLGPLKIDGLSRRVKRAATYQLLSYLALHPKGAGRDELVEAIWPAQDPARTRPRFWQSVSEARKALGDAWLHDGERYQLDRTKVRIDLEELDELLSAASTEDAGSAQTLERALALWRGEPLEGSDYLWADGEIRSLRATLLDLLERVGRLRLAGHDARGALQIAEQAIGLDGLHEPSWRLALQAESALGLRESITRRYDELARVLDEQLGLEPTRETRVIYRQLLAQT